MGSIDDLLEDYKDDGVEDSSGAFTIDFQKAREKLAKFQLADPHELILKFVQAGNLAAESISIAAETLLTVNFSGWNPELTLERLADRLASASLIVGDDPLTHVCIGLSALLGLAPDGITIRQSLPEQSDVKVLVVGQTLERETEVGTKGPYSWLEISVPLPKQLSPTTLGELLSQRCAFTAVPIHWQGQDLETRIPDTPGAHRGAFFRENRVLAAHSLNRPDAEKPPLLGPWARTAKSMAGERMTYLNLTVDLDPKATIWLCKAGVLAEKKRFDLGIPGVVGVVAADGVNTDLTGSQFLEGPALEGIEKWLGSCAVPLLDDALVSSKSILSEAQPASSIAPVNVKYATSGCTVAFVGWMIGVLLISLSPGASGTSNWVMPNLLFWVFFPMIWVAIALWRHGCEKDENSDQKAKEELFATLSRAKTRGSLPSFKHAAERP